MKLCIDCKHYAPPNAYLCIFEARCGYKPSPVNGAAVDACEYERVVVGGHCGPDAIHFEARPRPPAPEKRSWWRWLGEGWDMPTP